MYSRVLTSYMVLTFRQQAVSPISKLHLPLMSCKVHSIRIYTSEKCWWGQILCYLWVFPQMCLSEFSCEGQMRCGQEDKLPPLDGWGGGQHVSVAKLSAVNCHPCDPLFLFHFTWFAGFTAITFRNDRPASAYKQSARQQTRQWRHAVSKMYGGRSHFNTFGQVWYCD